MLIVAASGVVLFTLAAGIFVYLNTQSLISAASWVQHTQEVLSSLQRASLLTERVEYRTRIYLLTGDEDQLNRARTAVNLLSTSVAHIEMLVKDNESQTSSQKELASDVEQLGKAFNGFNAKSTAPEAQIQRCQQVIGLMTDREQWLLGERSQGSQRNSFTSITTEIAFVGLSLLMLVVLFGILLRDAVRRQRIDRQTRLTNERLARSVNELEDMAHETALLTAARDELQLCVDIQQLYRSAALSFSRLIPESAGCLCMINNSRQAVELVSSWGATVMEDFSPPESCCGLRSGQPRWRLPGQSEIHCRHFAGKAPDRYLCKPIVAHGNTLGILYLQCENEAVVQSVNQRMDGLRHLVQITGMAIATLNLRTKLEHQSIRDALTGLFNRHFMQISLERELSRAARRKQILAVLMLDVDHFKQFNDTHGHVAGDAVLREIAKIFQANIRAEDVACRYGGEEFTILLPDVSADIALERAEKILEAVANLQVTLDTQTYREFGVSIGIAFYPADGDSADLLLRRADEALYRSKRNGRNRVSVTEGHVVSG